MISKFKDMVGHKCEWCDDVNYDPISATYHVHKKHPEELEIWSENNSWLDIITLRDSVPEEIRQ